MDKTKTKSKQTKSNEAPFEPPMRSWELQAKSLEQAAYSLVAESEFAEQRVMEARQKIAEAWTNPKWGMNEAQHYADLHTKDARGCEEQLEKLLKAIGILSDYALRTYIIELTPGWSAIVAQAEQLRKQTLDEAELPF